MVDKRTELRMGKLEAEKNIVETQYKELRKENDNLKEENEKLKKRINQLERDSCL